MKKLLLFLLPIFLFISCERKSGYLTVKKHEDSIITLNQILNLYSDSIQVLHDSLLFINKNEIEKFEIVKYNNFKGRDLYVKNCKFCHGETGVGDGIKTKIDTSLCPHDISGEEFKEHDVYFVILNGKNKMPGRSQKLSDDDIWLLVFYVKKLYK